MCSLEIALKFPGHITAPRADAFMKEVVQQLTLDSKKDDKKTDKNEKSEKSDDTGSDGKEDKNADMND